MRTAIIAAAALAAGALAVPMEKRAVVTEVDRNVVYVTQYTTVTAGAQETAAAEPEAASTKHYGHHVQWGNRPNWWKPNKGKTTKTAPAATWEPAPTTTAAATPTETYSPPAETTSASSGGSAPAGYASTVVDSHNVHRANHSASDVTWSQELADIAQQIANSCSYEHNTAIGSDQIKYGQNIAAGVDGDSVARVISNMFYNGEVNYYDGLYGEAQPDMSNFEHWGHFSQIVWKSTTSVGCYTKHCPQGLANTGPSVPPYFTVCNYGPPGNYANEYGDNVLKPLGQPTVSAPE